MSETNKPSVGEVIAEKNEEKENEIKPVDEQNKGKSEKKEEHLKMEDAANEKGMEVKESKIGKEVQEEKPMKEEMEKECNKDQKDVEVAKDNGEETAEQIEKTEEKDDKNEKQPVESEEGKVKEKKRGKRSRNREVGEKGGNVEKKVGRNRKDVLSTPIASSTDRPVRERKSVERLVETLRKEPSKAVLIEKGQGTPLKDIPNVAYKLSKRKPDAIRSLHLLLFGRRGKASNFKSHIFQFSGFVWHENEEKQRAKVKEKLDKCIKDKLLDFCDVFDIPVSRATSRKEDLVEKLLDFMVAPHATTDVILAEKEQSTKSRKRKKITRGRPSKRTPGTPGKRSRKKQTKGEVTAKSEQSANETEDEDGDGDEHEDGADDTENSLPDEDEAIKPSENEENESEHDDSEEEFSHKGRQVSKKLKMRGSPVKASKKATTPKKAPLTASTKSPTKASSKLGFAEDKDAPEKALKKKKDDVTPKEKMPSPKPDSKERRTSGKKAGRGKAKSDQAEDSGPTEEELRNSICEILKEVDFNTATFTDILKRLASHYKMDMAARKASIRLMIQDELTKLAEEDEDEDDDNADAIDEVPEPKGKKLKA